MDTPNTAALAERAMLVSLRLSCWLPPVVDRKITREIAQRHGVSEEEVRFSKMLIHPKTPSYLALRQAHGNLRTRHYWYTLPWAHRGPRILPAVNFAKYSEEMREGTQTYLDAVDVFCGEFPRLQTLAIAKSKGLITAADFPTNIRERFGAEHQVMPIPTVGDFRVQMSEADAQALRAQMEAGVAQQEREALVLAMREPYERLYEHVKRMVERLTDPKPKFQDSLVTGLRDLCAALPALNITGDANLTAMAKLAEQMVAGVDPQQLRDVPVLRERVAKDAEALKEKLAPIATKQAAAPSAADEITRQAASIEAAMGGFMQFGVHGE